MFHGVSELVPRLFARSVAPCSAALPQRPVSVSVALPTFPAQASAIAQLRLVKQMYSFNTDLDEFTPRPREPQGFGAARELALREEKKAAQALEARRPFASSCFRDAALKAIHLQIERLRVKQLSLTSCETESTTVGSSSEEEGSMSTAASTLLESAAEDEDGWTKEELEVWEREKRARHAWEDARVAEMLENSIPRSEDFEDDWEEQDEEEEFETQREVARVVFVEAARAGKEWRRRTISERLDKEEHRADALAALTSGKPHYATAAWPQVHDHALYNRLADFFGQAHLSVSTAHRRR